MALWRRIKAKSSRLNVYKSAPTRRAQFGSPIIFLCLMALTAVYRQATTGQYNAPPLRSQTNGGTHDTQQQESEERNERSFDRGSHPRLPVDGELGPDDRGEHGDRLRERARGSSVGCRKGGFFSQERD